MEDIIVRRETMHSPVLVASLSVGAHTSWMHQSRWYLHKTTSFNWSAMREGFSDSGKLKEKAKARYVQVPRVALVWLCFSLVCKHTAETSKPEERSISPS
jgi:hypothetical protein